MGRRLTKVALAAACIGAGLLGSASPGLAATLTGPAWSVSSTAAGGTGVRYTYSFATVTPAILSSVTMTVPAGTGGIPGVGMVSGLGAGTATLSGTTLTYTVTTPLLVAAGIAVSIQLTGLTSTGIARTYTSIVTTNAASLTIDTGTTNAVTITTPAVPTITAGPVSPGNSRTPTWSFTAPVGTTTSCQLSSGAIVVVAYGLCTSPKSYGLTGQPDATYTFSVTDTDAVGNVSAAATSSYPLQTTPPAPPTITASPVSPGNSRNPTWSLTAPGGTTASCQLSFGANVVFAYASCTSTTSYDLTGQPDATYTFSVTATDAVGNVGTAAASNYILLTTLPAAPTITLSPGTPGNSRAPTWSFIAPDGTTTSCQLSRGDTMFSAYASCTSPKTYDLTAPLDGTYTFSVTATDAAGNVSTAAISTYTMLTTLTTPPANVPALMQRVGPGIAARAAFPVLLLVIVVAFLLVQDRIDRKDPKLALAPMHAEPDLPFDSP